jgi:hypothetical protein
MKIESIQQLLQSLLRPAERNNHNNYRFRDSLNSIDERDKHRASSATPQLDNTNAAVPMAGWLNELRAQKEKAAGLQNQRRKEQKGE